MRPYNVNKIIMCNAHYPGSEELENTRLLNNYNQHIARLFTQHIQPDTQILDFGAGTGIITDIIKATTSHHPDCIEIDKNNKATLKSKGYHVTDTLKECKKSHYQIVYSSNVLEHIKNDTQVIQNIHTVLKPGGIFITYVPAFKLLWTKMDERVGHIRRYKKLELKQKALNAGFQIHSIFYQDSLGFFLALLFKIINNNGKVNGKSLIFYDRFLFKISRFLDFFFKNWFGKNIVLIAIKPNNSNQQ